MPTVNTPEEAAAKLAYVKANVTFKEASEAARKARLSAHNNDNAKTRAKVAAADKALNEAIVAVAETSAAYNAARRIVNGDS